MGFGITFDGTISLGALVNAAVLLIGFVVAFTRLGGRLDLLSLRLQGVETVLAATQKFDIRITLIEERISNLQKEIAALKRGEGWSHEKPRTGVDGEY